MILSTTLDDISPADDVDGDVIARNVSRPSRISMEELYQQSTPQVVDGDIDSPPSYEADALLQKPLQRRKFNIQPREDEGREILPPYSSEISLMNVFQRKMELEGAVHRARDRNWYRAWVTLQGTALTFHKVKTGLFDGLPHDNPTADMALPGKKGKFVKSYNLQHADVGIAADYLKKRYVIRIRAECDQFLITCFKIETFIHWLQSLFAAIDIAPPLDTRSLPRDLSIPRYRPSRSTRSSNYSDIERNAELVREQVAIMRAQYPRLVDPTIEAAQSASRPSTSHTQTRRSASSLIVSSTGGMAPNFGRRSRPEVRVVISPQAQTDPLCPLPSEQPSQATSELPSPSDNENPSLSPTGKWQPPHPQNPNRDILYAKQCMAILTHCSPRKSNYTILGGKQWIIDWATGELTRCEPPDYREFVEPEEQAVSGHILDVVVARRARFA